MQFLLLSDIHGNYPALAAVWENMQGRDFDHIINCGDSLVYAPFPNETIDWLNSGKAPEVHSILGNTDKKVIKLLLGKTFKKPSKKDKRMMYIATAKALTKENARHLKSYKKSLKLVIKSEKHKKDSRTFRLGIFHGSPAAHHEFLFSDTPSSRFRELAGLAGCDIIITGHSHTPYHKYVAKTHFINPGSVGRMFDGNPQASFATLELSEEGAKVHHYRIPYDIEAVVSRLKREKMPTIYHRMYRQGRKLN